MCSNHSLEYLSTPSLGNNSFCEIFIADRKSGRRPSHCIIWCCCNEFSRLSQRFSVDVPHSTVGVGTHVQSAHRPTDDEIRRNVCLDRGHRCEFVYATRTSVEQPCRYSTCSRRFTASWNIAVFLGLLRAMDLARNNPLLLRRIFHHRGGCVCVVNETTYRAWRSKYRHCSRPFMVASKPVARWQLDELALSLAQFATQSAHSHIC